MPDNEHPNLMKNNALSYSKNLPKRKRNFVFGFDSSISTVEAVGAGAAGAAELELGPSDEDPRRLPLPTKD